MHWRLSQLYRDVDDMGFYDFAKNAQILLEAVELATDLTPDNVIKFLMGGTDWCLNRYNYHYLYGISINNGITQKYFWEALIEQLRLHHFIEMVFLNEYCSGMRTNARKTRIIATSAGKKWLKRAEPKTLKLKAIGQMYAFFEKKPDTPLVSSCIQQPPPDTSKMYNNFKMEPKNYVINEVLFETCLMAVRTELAKTENIEPKAVASDLMIKRLMEKRPSNLDEFIQCHFDGFNHAKTYKYGPSLVNAVNEFKVSNCFFTFLICSFTFSKFQNFFQLKFSGWTP